jgi:hypothetical protein
MVPTVEFPLTTPLMDHVTEAFVAPVTVAANCCAPPARTLEVVGAMVTCTTGTGLCLRSAVLVPLVVPQPATQTAAKKEKTLM